MNSIEVILLNFSEIRRRSINLWSGIPLQNLNWRPDKRAFSIIEMIRHVLEGEHLFHKIIQNQGNIGNYKSPWEDLAYLDLKTELDFSKRYRIEFLNMIKELNEADLKTIRIERKEVGQSKNLGDYLNRIAYHESVHTGQMLHYLREANIKRPIIWD
ncbi:putative damage-inducible protein DinB [Maribacter vaceletii]|uniref:Putative damage-inducible protein DinB n=1 Tax=Maribacter vaceletii TaxID=1206816 RepID=A0A495E8J4_9FLAO|nr:DinB family protein [Maribacter vaceletii]RKR13265.1 putative damage-inducible protein DinB [Maribacter vaceletii]